MTRRPCGRSIVGVSALSGFMMIPEAGATNFIGIDTTGLSNGSSRPEACNDHEDTLDAAAARDEIGVSKGTYVSTARMDSNDLRTATFEMNTHVTMIGGLAGTESRIPAVHNLSLNEILLGGDVSSPKNDTFPTLGFAIDAGETKGLRAGNSRLDFDGV